MSTRMYGPILGQLKPAKIVPADGDKEAKLELGITTALEEKSVKDLVAFARRGDKIHLVAVERDAGLQQELFEAQEIDEDHCLEIDDVDGIARTIPAASLRDLFEKFQAGKLAVERIQEADDFDTLGAEGIMGMNNLDELAESILGNKVPEIAKSILNASEELCEELHSQESKGKQRKSVLDAIAKRFEVLAAEREEQRVAAAG